MPTIPLPNVPVGAKPKITPEMLKNSKNVTCSCGGILFRQSVAFKKISPILSPSGKEEILPIDVVVCEKCNLVNRELMVHDILPEFVMEKSSISLNTTTFVSSTGSF